MSDYPDEEMKAMEEDYRRVTNKCDEQQPKCRRCKRPLGKFEISRFKGYCNECYLDEKEFSKGEQPQ